MEERLKELCRRVKEQIENGDEKDAYAGIVQAMEECPDSGIPHNLMGIWKENQGDHPGAMKHFRAAWALEPTFVPARWNLDVYGRDDSGKCAYTDEDVPEEQEKPGYKWVYDEKGIGHMVRRDET